MKAVILCAGKSTRTYPLTLTRPKPLIPLGKATLLEHNLEQISGFCTEVILVIGYKGEMIRKQIGQRYGGLHISYVEQREQRGTGHALLQAKSLIGADAMLVLMGDDLYFAEDLTNMTKHCPSILAMAVHDPSRFGVLEANKGKLTGLIEKPEHPRSNLANTACYNLPLAIFSHLARLTDSPRGERELTSAVLSLSRDLPVRVVMARRWITIGYPWDLFAAKKMLYPEGYVDPCATVKGRVQNSIIGAGCVVLGKVTDSILFPACVVDKKSSVSHSILGEGVRLRKTSITSGKAMVMANNKSVAVNTLGAVLGDESEVTDGTVAAGTLMGPHKKLSGQLRGVYYD